MRWRQFLAARSAEDGGFKKYHQQRRIRALDFGFIVLYLQKTKKQKKQKMKIIQLVKIQRDPTILLSTSTKIQVTVERNEKNKCKFNSH